MIKVVPYIQTMGTERFNDFLSTPFNFNVLYSQHNRPCFDGWKFKDMMGWSKYTHDKITLEVYPETYNIIYKSKVYTLPLPKSINEFINDMCRFEIQLYWSDWVNENFEPRDYLKKDEIQNYYSLLLDKLGKSFELL